jgi:hypothetical protein
MNVILCTSVEKLDAVIKRAHHKKSPLYVALVSDVLRVKDMPKDLRVYMYSNLIPTPFLINEYIMNGMTEEYIEHVKSHFITPITQFFIISAIRDALAMDANIVFACAEEEKEFGYILLLGETIEAVTGIHPVKAKKFLEGKKSTTHFTKDKTFTIVSDMTDDLLDKLDALDFKLPLDLNIRFTSEEIKKLPKDIRKQIKKYWDEKRRYV